MIKYLSLLGCTGIQYRKSYLKYFQLANEMRENTFQRVLFRNYNKNFHLGLSLKLTSQNSSCISDLQMTCIIALFLNLGEVYWCLQIMPGIDTDLHV